MHARSGLAPTHRSVDANPLLILYSEKTAKEWNAIVPSSASANHCDNNLSSSADVGRFRSSEPARMAVEVESKSRELGHANARARQSNPNLWQDELPVDDMSRY